MPNWIDATGIHWVRDKAAAPMEKPKPEVCGKCGMPATCVGRLYVPAHALSVNRAVEDVSILLCGKGLFWCNRHFSQLRAAEFLEGERGREIREAVARQFKERNAFPNFDKAVIGRIPQTDHDYLRAQKAIEIARKN